ncbi:c-type cytochrome [Novosphingobium mathurense]|uniref:Cytochrome c n=1 Tax=Novosphingobium mathurense TaxID=428990 RepID=A0A1U6I2P2_9SPHN|nr:cytochrome c [Novosphingobium mathurense]SLK02247.1 Cytochrome c [Novosphingobium mathurense]
MIPRAYLLATLTALATITAGGLGAAQASPPSPASTQDGAVLFKRCAACHTATGAGVPGAYPPLQRDFRELATSKDGRRYLSLAVIRGLSGPIEVEGKTYRGLMPAQSGLDDDDIASVLNHIGTKIAKTGPAFKAFTSAEVAAARKSGAALSAAQVAKLHAGAGPK